MGRTATVAIFVALLAAGCGGGGDTTTQRSTTLAQSAPAITTTITLSSATTRRVETHTTRSTSLKPTGGYTCNGKALRALSSDGPVKVEPPVVKPGQSFTVLVTDRSVKVAQVTLTGVSATPITANGVGADGGLAARMEMPRSAGCGNKLLEVEGDLSAEAYVGVSG